MALRITVLSSTPLNPREGSGTFVGIAGLNQGLERLGHQVTVRPLGRRTGFHTLDRWLYNAGVARPLNVIAPPGTIVNAQRPAAVAGGNVETSQRITDVVLGALGRALPDRLPATVLLVTTLLVAAVVAGATVWRYRGA